MKATPKATEAPCDPPGVAAAWRALWLLVWRSRFSTRKLPLLIFSVIAAPLLAYFASEPGSPDGYVELALGVYLLLLLPLYCLAVCGSMIRDELQSGTLGFLVTRPLTRARLFLIDFAAHILWLQGIALANGLLLVLVGIIRSVPDVLAVGGRLFAVQALAVFVYGALSALLGLVTRRYIVLGVLYGFIVEIGIGRIPINIHLLSMTHHLQSLMGTAVLVQEEMGWDPGNVWLAISILLGATIVFLVLGAVLFTWREYHARDDMHK